ncbi:GyrI-like domain-containing protein [Clostridium estertheticum]|uniref:GyrI-like domain-containing protein n=1 Tax=Clostridium estertheticum TaxID=238834 RepID=UPI0013E960F3|nr:GyrI-like domain-containing protein [Clostridium estertheticum]MBZ9689612.1 GyrI-like domain-containing protein [Clostridium estertheticum]
MDTKKLDYKKEYKDLYLPKQKPVVVDIPAMNFIMVNGSGNPNDPCGEYQKAVELLYGLSYTIKMSKRNGCEPKDYFDYVVPPLEGLWWIEEKTMDFTQKSKFSWTSMIRQPEFVTNEVFQWACEELKRKKPEIDTSKAYLETFSEGLCVQMMHIGPFDDESKTIKLIETYISENNFKNAISSVQPDGRIRRHHEIYLSDLRKTAPERLKTVLRHPVVKAD